MTLCCQLHHKHWFSPAKKSKSWKFTSLWKPSISIIELNFLMQLVPNSENIWQGSSAIYPIPPIWIKYLMAKFLVRYLVLLLKSSGENWKIFLNFKAMHIYCAEAKDINLILLTCFSFRLFKLNRGHLNKNQRDEYRIYYEVKYEFCNWTFSILILVYLRERSSKDVQANSPLQYIMCEML